MGHDQRFDKVVDVIADDSYQPVWRNARGPQRLINSTYLVRHLTPYRFGALEAWQQFLHPTDDTPWTTDAGCLA
jgi:hypothetical protein